MYSQIADNSKNHRAASNGLDSRGYRFSHCIHCIGSHGVTTIDEDVYDDHRAGFRIDYSSFEPPTTSSKLDQNGINFVTGFNQTILCLQYSTFCPKRIRTTHDLNLSNHNGVGVV